MNSHGPSSPLPNTGLGGLYQPIPAHSSLPSPRPLQSHFPSSRARGRGFAAMASRRTLASSVLSVTPHPPPPSPPRLRVLDPGTSGAERPEGMPRPEHAAWGWPAAAHLTDYNSEITTWLLFAFHLLLPLGWFRGHEKFGGVLGLFYSIIMFAFTSQPFPQVVWLLDRVLWLAGDCCAFCPVFALLSQQFGSDVSVKLSIKPGRYFILVSAFFLKKKKLLMFVCEFWFGVSLEAQTFIYANFLVSYSNSLCRSMCYAPFLHSD